MVIFHCYVSPPEGSYRDLNDPECCDLIQKIIPWVSTAFPRRANEWKMRDLWQGDQNNSFYVTQFTSEIIRVPQVLHQNFYPLNPSQNFPCFVRLQFRLFFSISFYLFIVEVCLLMLALFWSDEKSAQCVTLSHRTSAFSSSNCSFWVTQDARPKVTNKNGTMIAIEEPYERTTFDQVDLWPINLLISTGQSEESAQPLLDG